MSREDWAVTQSELVAHERWIVDGNYSNTFDLRFARADTVIVLDFPRRVCMYRALKRIVLNWHRDTQAPGCPERFDLEFLRWLWDFPRDSRPVLDDALSRFHGRVNVVQLRTPAAAREYLSDLARHP
jgi:adenylate kinase family enzyme